jgi:hypothetical protein
MAFKPGESGNPDGRPKDHKFLQALNRAIAQDDGRRLRSAAEKLLDLASTGEQWAVKELADRLDGKPAQTVGGDPDRPLRFLLDAPWLTKAIAQRNSA